MAIQVQGKYKTTAPTITADGFIQPLLVDSHGNLLVNLAAGANVVIDKVGIDQTTPGTTNAVAVKGSSDGGTTWYPLKADASGSQYTYATITGVTAAKLQNGKMTADEVTCTLASQDYASANAIPASTKYVTVYSPNAAIVAVGEVTKSASTGAQLFDPVIFDPLIFDSGGSQGAVGVYVGAGQPTTFPLAAADVTGSLKLHCQSATAGNVVRFTYQQD